MPWKAIACSAKGTSHEKIGSPCQDYAGFIRVNDSGETDDNGDIAIGAVCDGAGSCKYSDIGSQLAVKKTLQYLQGWLKWLKEEKKDLSEPISEDSAHNIFGKNLAKVQEAFRVKAQEMACYSKDFSCTLLVVVATPKWLAAMQIGDGFIVIRQPDLKDKLSEYKLLFQPIKGEYANQTTFITASNALQVMQVKVLPGPQQFIFASTDGLERLALENGKESKPYPQFFDSFRDAIQIRLEAEEKKSMEKWLQWEEVNNRTDDDKTILLCWYKSADELKQSTETSQSSAIVHTSSQAIPTIQLPGGATRNSPQPTPAPQPLGGVTSQTTQTRVAQPSENAISQSDSNSEPPSSGVSDSLDNQSQLVRKIDEKEDCYIEIYALVINLLSGIFWNSLWHDLFVNISFRSSGFRNFVGLVLAILLTVLILLVDWHIYQKIKQYYPNKSKKSLFFYMALICAVGLGLGGLVYYLIRLGLLYLSNVSIELPK
ncbi:PP2C family serine/threonine-protein phosphatase [Planktothricoides raciborskii]|uniref:Protein phosphatase 2C domain-containing protein n=1 Tax=Planktothricoides raciborskii FACHB-1370 TaxID=2949576 RepID=A0ABR8EAB6_9CYAN|nr:PP2C family serine/threonine-protein phosphatase [Planktothricoides raciborskii]MBD2543686.1 protein phosphatase 2C domain-containing protein [Planktothricoides raciborskii FACHB-1370]MBD2582421.1 protein phosphatase 2C domain-containing protein [Planktothricoides raciborskii FACHB-1261]